MVIGDGAYGDAATLAAMSERVSLEGAEPRFIPVGRSGKNLSISEFSVRRYPLDKSRYEVMLEVANLNDTPADVELELSGDGVIVDVTRLKLGPKETLPRYYQDLAGASRTLTARIKASPGTDDLPADDVAYALLPERRRARILVVSAGNTYLEASLLLDEYLDVTQITPGASLARRQIRPSPSSTTVAPPLSDRIGAALYLNPARSRITCAVRRGDRRVRLRHLGAQEPRLALHVRWATFKSPRAIRSSPRPRAGDRVLGASDHGTESWSAARVTVTASSRSASTPRDSDLVLRIAWPLFVLNTIKRLHRRRHRLRVVVPHR